MEEENKLFKALIVSVCLRWKSNPHISIEGFVTMSYHIPVRMAIKTDMKNNIRVGTHVKKRELYGKNGE